MLTWLAVLVFSLALGSIYAWMVGGRPFVGAINGAAIGGIIGALELLVVDRPRGRALRNRGLIWFIGCMTVVWIAVIYFVQWTTNFFWGHPWGATPEMHAKSNMLKDTLVVFAFGYLFNFGLRIQSLVGPRVLFNFLTGKYYRPQREERAIVFIDLADSTALAEQLGDLRFHELLARFFFDIAQPTAEYHGEVHRYIGDSVLLTWPLATAQAGALPVKCVFGAQKMIRDRASYYEREFSVVPQFRIGAHAGPIVAGEVGDERREIVYIGDTMNTTARLQSQCKEVGRDFMVSQAFLDAMPALPGVVSEDLGYIELPGKREKIHAFALVAEDTVRCAATLSRAEQIRAHG